MQYHLKMEIILVSPFFLFEFSTSFTIGKSLGIKFDKF